MKNMLAPTPIIAVFFSLFFYNYFISFIQFVCFCCCCILVVFIIPKQLRKHLKIFKRWRKMRCTQANWIDARRGNKSRQIHEKKTPSSRFDLVDEICAGCHKMTERKANGNLLLKMVRSCIIPMNFICARADFFPFFNISSSSTFFASSFWKRKWS